MTVIKTSHDLIPGKVYGNTNTETTTDMHGVECHIPFKVVKEATVEDYFNWIETQGYNRKTFNPMWLVEKKFYFVLMD